MAFVVLVLGYVVVRSRPKPADPDAIPAPGVASATARDLLNRANVDFASEDRAARHGRAQVKNYFAAVTGIDDQFGRILKLLDDEGLANDTIVVFTSDHGEMMASHDRMQKVVWYEESLGIPCIVRWPGRIAPRRDDLLLSVPDTMPSLLGLMGLGDKTPDGVEGADHSAMMLGAKAPARPDSALYLNVKPARPEIGRRGGRTPPHTVARHRPNAGGTTPVPGLNGSPGVSG